MRTNIYKKGRSYVKISLNTQVKELNKLRGDVLGYELEPVITSEIQEVEGLKIEEKKANKHLSKVLGCCGSRIDEINKEIEIEIECSKLEDAPIIERTQEKRYSTDDLHEYVKQGDNMPIGKLLTLVGRKWGIQ